MTEQFNESTEWCEKAERGGLSCKPCYDSVCQVRSKREQRLYKGYDIHDTIVIEPAKTGGFNIQTDIEIPFAVDPKKGAAQVRDKMAKNKVILTMALGPKIPEGIRGPWFHPHHSPNRLPEVAALHVHIAGTAKSFMEAKRMADDFWDIIDADRLTKLLE
jgi:hypothetical protein